MKRYIIGLGETLWDVFPEGKQLGGAPANFAHHASQFGHPAIAISAVGNDALGNEIVALLEERGLTHLLPRVDCPTGTVQVTLDAQGIPSYEIVENVAWDNIPFTPEMEEVAKHARAVCWGSLAQRSEVSRTTINRLLDATPADCLKIFDINLRQHFYTKEIIENSLRRADVLKINDEELELLTPMLNLPVGDERTKAQRLLQAYDLQLVVLTCGTNGSYVFTAEADSFHETPMVEVADTVGAGDSFTAAFCAALLRAKPIVDAHRLAVQTSAYVCTQKGAMPQLPETLKG